MKPGKHNFTFKQGDTWSQRFCIKIDSTTPMDLTGYIARMDIRKFTTSLEADISLTTENSKISIPSPETGYVYLLLAATETADLSGKYVYDIELITGVTVITPLRGELIIIPEVTRPDSEE